MIVSDPTRRDSGTIFHLKHWIHKVIKILYGVIICNGKLLAGVMQELLISSILSYYLRILQQKTKRKLFEF